MRSCTSCLFVVLLLPTLTARPLAFEQRSPDRFVVQFGDTHALFRPGEVSIGPITIRFLGSSGRVRLEGEGKASPSTYILPGLRRTFQQYPRLALRHLYPGIDAIFYGNGDHLEYDLLAGPHAHFENVQLVLAGAAQVRLNQDGGLRIEAGSGVLEQKLPRVFQSDGLEIAARYALLPGNRVAIRLGPHDARLGLTIDPELAYTRYFGGSGSDSASLVTPDAQGNLYVAGRSNSVNFPTTNGFQPNISPPLLALSNAGQTVTRLPVGDENSVISLAGTPDGAVVYALTPDALYVTSDQGATWQQRPPPFQTIIGQPSTIQVTVSDFAVDPIDPSQVFLATNRGLLSSGTGGLEGWGLNETGLPVGGNGSVNATWVTVSPIDHLTLYATTSQPGGLFKTTNHGVTWQALNPQVPGEVTNTPFPPVAALASNGTDLYVVDAFSNLLKSTDSGSTWQLLGQGLYGARMVALDPNAPNVYVTDFAGLQVSHDGGQTFATAPLPPVTSNLGAQQVAVDAATGNVYVGLQSSIYVSTDAGKTFQPVQATAPNLHALAALGGQVYAGADTPSVPFVMKLDPTGTQILYSTFLGGSLGDAINGIAVDAQGNCTVAGVTISPDFQVITTISSASPTGQPSGFVTKLSADGTRLIYSSLLGASKGVAVGSVALDVSGAAYITGQTPSRDFPTTPNSVQPAVPTSMCTRPSSSLFPSTNTGMNAFVSKLSTDGSALAYSTFLTGSCGSAGLGIGVDAAGEVIVVGSTTSPDFPTTPNAYQAAFPGLPDGPSPPNPLDAGFVTKLSAGGDKVLASSYLGGGGLTQANAVAVDSAGSVSLTGATIGMARGATPGAFQKKTADRCEPTISIGPSFPQYGTTDAFVLKLDPMLSTAQYLTYLGGACNDSGTGISLDPAGNAWIVGTTNSPDFPTRSLFQGQGISSGFVSEMSADRSQLLFSSWTDGVSLALDALGTAYLAGAAQGVSGIPKTAVEVLRIDPSTTPAVVIDGINAVTGYPAALLPPFASGIAPGQLIQIGGRNLGPATAVNGQADATGRQATVVGNTSVFFDEIPAPLLSVGASTIECFAPFEITRTTNVTVVSNSQKSNTVRLGVTATAPQILSVTNQDGTLNSASNPAHVGSTIVIYSSGLGETSPLSVDGLVNSAPLPVPLAAVTVYLPGIEVQPQFLGAAPGMIAGIVQVNVLLPMINYPMSPLSASVSLNGASAPLYVAQ